MPYNFKQVWANAGDADGVDIAKIEKTNTSGLVDTYTITLTNGKTSNFTTDGIDTNKLGDVPPSYVPQGFTFSSKHGVAIYGEMPIYARMEVDGSYKSQDDENFRFFSTFAAKRVVEQGIYTDVPKSDFGDAMPSDVRAGKKFTSANGVNITGTNTGEGISVDIGVGQITVDLSDVTSGYVEVWYTTLTAGGSIERRSYVIDAGKKLSMPRAVTGSILVLKFPNYTQLYDDTTNVITHEWSGENGGTVTYCFNVVASQSNEQIIRFWS